MQQHIVAGVLRFAGVGNFAWHPAFAGFYAFLLVQSTEHLPNFGPRTSSLFLGAVRKPLKNWWIKRVITGLFAPYLMIIGGLWLEIFGDF
ncbi:hypothetical protein ACFFWB_26685 [Flavobacterium procerum]|uniref:hypothetical protein n=1 Tax=Flavobacterium procerum TaxID=1455569 RepID=UPI0035E6AF66